MFSSSASVSFSNGEANGCMMPFFFGADGCSCSCSCSSNDDAASCLTARCTSLCCCFHRSASKDRSAIELLRFGILQSVDDRRRARPMCGAVQASRFSDSIPCVGSRGERNLLRLRRVASFGSGNGHIFEKIKESAPSSSASSLLSSYRWLFVLHGPASSTWAIVLRSTSTQFPFFDFSLKFFFQYISSSRHR